MQNYSSKFRMLQQPIWIKLTFSALMTLFSLMISQNFIIRISWNGKNLNDSFLGNVIIFVFYYLIISFFLFLFKLVKRIL